MGAKHLHRFRHRSKTNDFDDYTQAYVSENVAAIRLSSSSNSLDEEDDSLSSSPSLPSSQASSKKPHKSPVSSLGHRAPRSFKNQNGSESIASDSDSEQVDKLKSAPPPSVKEQQAPLKKGRSIGKENEFKTRSQISQFLIHL